MHTVPSELIKQLKPLCMIWNSSTSVTAVIRQYQDRWRGSDSAAPPSADWAFCWGKMPRLPLLMPALLPALSSSCSIPQEAVWPQFLTACGHGATQGLSQGMLPGWSMEAAYPAVCQHHQHLTPHCSVEDTAWGPPIPMLPIKGYNSKSTQWPCWWPLWLALVPQALWSILCSCSQEFSGSSRLVQLSESPCLWASVFLVHVIIYPTLSKGWEKTGRAEQDREEDLSVYKMEALFSLWLNQVGKDP